LNIILSLDGVLRAESGEPNRAGVLVYYALNNLHRVALITKVNIAKSKYAAQPKDAQLWDE